jgi:hypothetical protein
MRKLLALLLCLSSFGLKPEPLVVGVSENLEQGDPQTIATIKAALLSTGLDLDIRTFPGERSAVLLSQGNIAMDIYRQPAAVAMIKELVAIKPSVRTLNFRLVTHKSTAHFCQLTPAQFFKHTVVGVRGARFFDNYVYDKFLNHEEVGNFSQALKMLIDKRVDFSVWPVKDFEKSLNLKDKNIHVCKGEPYITLKFYSYIHKKYSWAIPKIEKAYREYFLK